MQMLNAEILGENVLLIRGCDAAVRVTGETRERQTRKKRQLKFFSFFYYYLRRRRDVLSSGGSVKHKKILLSTLKLCLL